jgi:hypothetical protein
MAILKPAVIEQAAAKVGIFGSQGSGKTTTAALFLIGLSKTYHNGAPVAFLDTENGSDYLIPIFEAEGVPLLVVKSRAFKDMRAALTEAKDAGCCGYLVDSYTHPWQELCDTFKAKSRRKKLEFHHMDELKGMWRQWTDQFLNSPLHCIVNGRLGYEWGKDEEGELVKLGSKMKSESEAGYEPSLLIEMEGVRPANVVKGKQRSQIVHLAHVLKDRWRTLNGQTFEFKDINDYKAGDYKVVFNKFLPHWQRLAMANGVQRAVDGTRTSEGMLDDGGRTLAAQRAQQVEIALEVIQNTLAQVWPGQDTLSKQTRLAVIEAMFGQPSWTAVTKKPLETLDEGAALISFVKEQMKDRQPFETAAEAAAFVTMCKEQRAESQREAEAAAVI